MNLWQLPKSDIAGSLCLVDKLDLNKLIGDNLRRVREKRGLSQGQLAEAIGTLPTRISAIENGREPMGKEYIERVCRALDIQPWEFYVTEKTPIITDEKERETLYALREAERLHVAEDIARYGRFRIEEAKRQAAGSLDERLRKGREVLKKKREKKKTA